MQRIAALFVASLILALSGCSNMVRVEEIYSIEAPWSGQQRIVVSSRNGGVTLSVVPGDTLRVNGVKSARGATIEEASDNLAEVSVEAKADKSDPRVMRVSLEYPPHLAGKSIGASMVVETPAAVEAEISTGNGSVQVDGMRDRVNIRTGNGRVVLRDIQGEAVARTSNGRAEAYSVSGRTELSTSNGRVYAENIGGDLIAHTSNGGVEIVGARGSIDVDTSNGGVRVDARPPDEGRVAIRTSNGTITAELPASMRGRIELGASNGRVRTELGDVPLTHLDVSSQRLEADMNGGGAGVILARTSNGSIYLKCQ